MTAMAFKNVDELQQDEYWLTSAGCRDRPD